MPNYLARVVLHRLNSKGNDSYEDYDDFRTEMAKIGFEPAIEGVNMKTKNPVRNALPGGGLFYFDGNRTVNQTRLKTVSEAFEAVYAAVTEVVRDETKYIVDSNEPHTVLVSEVTDSEWSGLKPSPKPTGIKTKGRTS